MQCKFCSSEIPKNRNAHAKYCGSKCLKSAQMQRHGGLVAEDKLATSTTGAISEMLVAADLLARGFEVFRAVSASCSCDLTILMNGHFLRVEVKTAWPAVDGTLRPGSNIDRSKHDVLAVVSKDRTIIAYDPPLDMSGRHPLLRMADGGRPFLNLDALTRQSRSSDHISDTQRSARPADATDLNVQQSGRSKPAAIGEP